MRINLRINDATKEHVHSSLFIDGKNCGRIVLGREDFLPFAMMLKAGVETSKKDTFDLSGHVQFVSGTTGV